jgi:hypothetical protein
MYEHPKARPAKGTVKNRLASSRCEYSDIIGRTVRRALLYKRTDMIAPEKVYGALFGVGTLAAVPTSGMIVGVR